MIFFVWYSLTVNIIKCNQFSCLYKTKWLRYLCFLMHSTIVQHSLVYERWSSDIWLLTLLSNQTNYLLNGWYLLSLLTGSEEKVETLHLLQIILSSIAFQVFKASQVNHTINSFFLASFRFVYGFYIISLMNCN